MPLSEFDETTNRRPKRLESCPFVGSESGQPSKPQPDQAHQRGSDCLPKTFFGIFEGDAGFGGDRAFALSDKPACRGHRGVCSKSYAKDGAAKIPPNRDFASIDFASVFPSRRRVAGNFSFWLADFGGSATIGIIAVICLAYDLERILS